MTVIFTKATKEQARLRMALIGPSGSGKTYTALRIAAALRNGGRVALIDTERGSASKYADLFDFDTLSLVEFSPDRYIEAIEAAQAAKFDVLIIDSLSHAWAGKGGILEFVDLTTARSQSHNAYSEGWRKATPLHNRLVDTIIQADLHVIVTMRAKTEYVMEKDERTGKTAPRKVGIAPVQRDGLEYEFDVVGDIDADHRLIISKTRCPALTDGMFPLAGEDVAAVLKTWLGAGTPPQSKGPIWTPETATTGEEPQPESAKSDRPYPAETVRGLIRKNSGVWHPGKTWGDSLRDDTKTQPPSDAQVKAVASLMAAAVTREGMTQADIDHARHAVLLYCCKIEHTNALSKQEAHQIIELWKNGESWEPNQYAAQEAQNVVTAWQKAQGQAELPI